MRTLRFLHRSHVVFFCDEIIIDDDGSLEEEEEEAGSPSILGSRTRSESSRLCSPARLQECVVCYYVRVMMTTMNEDLRLWSTIEIGNVPVWPVFQFSMSSLSLEQLASS